MEWWTFWLPHTSWTAIPRSQSHDHCFLKFSKDCSGWSSLSVKDPFFVWKFRLSQTWKQCHDFTIYVILACKDCLDDGWRNKNNHIKNHNSVSAPRLDSCSLGFSPTCPSFGRWAMGIILPLLYTHHRSRCSFSSFFCSCLFSSWLLDTGFDFLSSWETSLRVCYSST